jgi:hypothetical protein
VSLIRLLVTLTVGVAVTSPLYATGAAPRGKVSLGCGHGIIWLTPGLPSNFGKLGGPGYRQVVIDVGPTGINLPRGTQVYYEYIGKNGAKIQASAVTQDVIHRYNNLVIDLENWGCTGAWYFATAGNLRAQ